MLVLMMLKKVNNYPSVDECIQARPSSLTKKRARELTGSMRPTVEEAEWILSLLKFGTWRWMSAIVTGDNNQITAMHLIKISKTVLGLDDG